MKPITYLSVREASQNKDRDADSTLPFESGRWVETGIAACLYRLLSIPSCYVFMTWPPKQPSLWKGPLIYTARRWFHISIDTNRAVSYHEPLGGKSLAFRNCLEVLYLHKWDAMVEEDIHKCLLILFFLSSQTIKPIFLVRLVQFSFWNCKL